MLLLRLGVLLFFSVGAAVFLAADWQSPLRVVVGLGFMLFVPGLAIAEMLGISDPLHRLAIATSASLAVETLVGLALLYAGLFTVERAFVIIYALSLLAVCVALLRAYRARV
jgi:uncharacterized membrane protein